MVKEKQIGVRISPAVAKFIETEVEDGYFSGYSDWVSAAINDYMCKRAAFRANVKNS